MEMPGHIIVDVRNNDLLTGVVLTARRPEQRHELTAIIRRSFPSLKFRQASEGVKIAALHSDILLDAPVELDLRWTPEAQQLVMNRTRAKASHPGLRNQLNGLLTGGKKSAAKLLTKVGDLAVLDDHQWTNVAAMTLPQGLGLCLFDEQGAGKTVTLIFAFDVLAERDEVDFALIIAPKSMVPEWPKDFSRFKGDLYKVDIITGNQRDKRAMLRSKADVLITNFETAISMEQELATLLRSYNGRAILVIDESFFIKNLDAKRTRSLCRLREWCDRAFVLCGTPAPNSPHDLIQQFNLVDFGVTFAGVDIPKDREQARPVIQQAIEQRGLYVRHLKSDVIPNLLPKKFNSVMLRMQPEQQKLYAGALQKLIVDLQSTDEKAFQRQLTSFFAQRSALLQICSNPASLVKGYKEVPTKLIALDSLLKEIILERKEKVVLWSFYTASIEAIVKRYNDFNPVRYDGTVSDVSERREAVRKFQEDNKTYLFVANPAAAGAGLTLHRARFAIYESMSNQAAHYLQSLDRIHRRGQQQQVEYLMLLCENSLEVQEYERLTNKEQAAQELLGDHVEQPLTRQTMLDDALAAANLFKRTA